MKTIKEWLNARPKSDRIKYLKIIEMGCLEDYMTGHMEFMMELVGKKIWDNLFLCEVPKYELWNLYKDRPRVIAEILSGNHGRFSIHAKNVDN